VAILHYLALVGTFVTTSLLLPILIGYGTGDTEQAGRLLYFTALGFFLAVSVLMATEGRGMTLDRTKSIYLVVIGWLIFPLILAIPISGLFAISYFDAWFEAVSAITTTAADGIRNSESSGTTAMVLRSTIQWLGGFLTLLTFVLFLGPIQVGGMPRPRTSIGEAATRSVIAVNRMAFNMFRYFSLATLLCFALLILCGVDAYSSLILTSTAVTAGGYVPTGTDLSSIANSPALLVMAAFFLLSSTSVFWHRMVIKWQVTNLKRHRESYFLLAVVFVLALIFLVAISSAAGSVAISDFGRVASEAIFNSASLVSTSGLQSRSGIFALLAPSFILALLIIGGGCFSTAGGLKYYRVGAMFFHSRIELSRLIYPSGIAKTKFGSERYNVGLMKSIWTMFLAASILIVLSANALALTGMDFHAGFTAAIAAFSNAGPAYSPDWVLRGTPGWPAYGEMAINQKIILSVVMIFGHLEVIALIVAVNPFYWLKR
jgi:trk system potassium uptake protein TrkH